MTEILRIMIIAAVCEQKGFGVGGQLSAKLRQLTTQTEIPRVKSAFNTTPTQAL